jgi:hypothetical protein
MTTSSQLKRTTLAERGPSLLIGIPDQGGVYQRAMNVGRWTGKAMREIGRIREETKEVGMGDHIRHVFSVLMEQLGEFEFTKLKPDRQKLVVAKMYMGDVFYAYIYSRVKALGPKLNLEIPCPACRHSFKWEGDLNTLTVSYVDRLEDAYWEYDLLEPLNTRGREVKTLAMGPALWHAVETSKVEGGLDFEGGKLALIGASVRGEVGRTEFPFGQAEIDELGGQDVETLVGLLDQNYVGPDLKISTACPRRSCRAPITQALDWSYQSFFGVSSRSRISGKSTTASLPLPTSQTEGSTGT